MRRHLEIWAPVVLWAALIFVLSSIPMLSSGLEGWDFWLRKAAHVVEFAILGALLWRALRRDLLSIALGIAYAASDEFHQTFVRGREGSVRDLAVDAVGVVLGVVVWRRR